MVKKETPWVTNPTKFFWLSWSIHIIDSCLCGHNSIGSWRVPESSTVLLFFLPFSLKIDTLNVSTEDLPTQPDKIDQEEAEKYCKRHVIKLNYQEQLFADSKSF